MISPSRNSPRVLIVGAGPAGSSAAYYLARRGANVILLEKARFPRDKVCGDGVTLRGTYSLQLMGIRAPISDHAQPIRAARFYAPSGRDFACPLPSGFFGNTCIVIERAKLDQLLVKRAVDAGAELQEGANVRSVNIGADGVSVHLADGNNREGDLIIGADGANSVVRRAMGVPDFGPSDSAIAYRGYFSGVNFRDSHEFQFHFTKELLPGYGWIFPLPEGRANVGIGFPETRIASRGLTPARAFQNFLREVNVRETLEGAVLEGRPRGHQLPLGDAVRRVSGDRALLVGDAAGFIHPITGDGIDYALESGKFAAETTLAAFESGRTLHTDALADYTGACAARFVDSFRMLGRQRDYLLRSGLVEKYVSFGSTAPGPAANLLTGWQGKFSWKHLVQALTA